MGNGKVLDFSLSFRRRYKCTIYDTWGKTRSSPQTSQINGPKNCSIPDKWENVWTSYELVCMVSKKKPQGHYCDVIHWTYHEVFQKICHWVILFMMQELLLSTNAPCMSCLPQRSYTLIVEALDFNNETSGKYFSLSGISILPSVHFFFFFFSFPPVTAVPGRSFVEGQGRKLILPEPPCPLPHGPLGGFVCACVLKCVDRWRWVKGSKRKKMGLGRAVRVEEGCPPRPLSFFFFLF